MPELDHHDIALLEILLHFVQAAFLHKRLGTATADSVVHNLDAGTVKETTQNLPPARLRVGIVLVVTDRGVANHVNLETRGIAHGDSREHSCSKKKF